MITSTSPFSFFRRLTAMGVLITFLFASNAPAPVLADSVILSGAKDLASEDPSAVGLRMTEFPENLGTIEEAFTGEKNKTVIMIQDAHGIPEAQRNIQKLIEHFQKNGVRNVALEGAASRLDTQFLKSYPNPKTLRELLESYFEKGELTGVNAAALFSSAGIFQGIEDWNLYQEGTGYYLAALEKEPQLSKKIEQEQAALKREKEKIYSEELLELDRVLESFQENHENLEEVLVKLAGPALRGRPLSVPPSVKIILDEMQNNKGHWGKEDFLRDQKFKEVQKKFFVEFEAYAKEVKEKLFRNEEERALDSRSRLLQLIKKLIRLELTKKEWEELKKFQVTTAKSQEGIDFLGSWHLALGACLSFYETAEKRDAVFFQKIQKMLSKEPAVIFVAGGFHAEDMTEQLKRAGISYVLLAPQMSEAPLTTHYREHMQGDVSWKSYFQGEKINLYDAFARAVRDRLMRQAPSSMGKETLGAWSLEPGASLKLWRDQIIRDLAAKRKIENAKRYTRFLDELRPGGPSAAPDILQKWHANADRFIAGLRELESSGRFNRQNILQLLQQPTTVEWALSFEPLRTFDARFLHLQDESAFRSEVRNAAYETYEEAMPEAKRQLVQIVQQLHNQELEWLNKRFGRIKVKMETVKNLEEEWGVHMRAVGDWKYDAARNLRDELKIVESNQNVIGMTEGPEAKGILGQIILSARVVKAGDEYVPIVLVDEIQGATGVKKGARQLNFRKQALKKIREAADKTEVILMAHTPHRFAGRLKPQEMIDVNYLYPFRKKEPGSHKALWNQYILEMSYDGHFYKTYLWRYESPALPSILSKFGLPQLGIPRSEMRPSASALGQQNRLGTGRSGQPQDASDTLLRRDDVRSEMRDLSAPSLWLANTIRQSDVYDQQVQGLTVEGLPPNLSRLEGMLHAEKRFVERVERRLTDDHSASDIFHERRKDSIFDLPFEKQIDLVMISLPLVVLNEISKKYWPGFADYFKKRFHEKITWQYKLDAAYYGSRIEIEITDYESKNVQRELFHIIQEIKGEMKEEMLYMQLLPPAKLKEFENRFDQVMDNLSIAHAAISFPKPSGRLPLPVHLKPLEISQAEFDAMSQKERKRFVLEYDAARRKLRRYWFEAASYWLDKMRNGKTLKIRNNARSKVNSYIDRILSDAVERLYERGEVLEKAKGKLQEKIQGLIKAQIKAKGGVPIFDQKMVQELIQKISTKPTLSQFYEALREGRRSAPPIFEYKGDGNPSSAGMPRRGHLISNLNHSLQILKDELQRLHKSRTAEALNRFKEAYRDYQEARDETLVLAYRDPRLKEYYKWEWISEVVTADSEGRLNRLKKRLLSFSSKAGDKFDQLSKMIEPGLFAYKRPVGDEVWFAVKTGRNQYQVLFSELNWGRGFFLQNPPDEEDSVYHRILVAYLDQVRKQYKKNRKEIWKALELFDAEIRRIAPQLYPAKAKLRGERVEAFVLPRDGTGYPTYARDRQGKLWKLHIDNGKMWKPAKREPKDLRPFMTSLSSASSYYDQPIEPEQVNDISALLDTLAEVQKQNPLFIHKVMSASELISAKTQKQARSEVRSPLTAEEMERIKPQYKTVQEFMDHLEEWQKANPDSKLVFFGRHGESMSNLFKYSQSYDFYSPLTLRGIAQAKAMAAFFEKIGFSFDRYIASNLERAYQSLAYLANGHGKKLEMLKRLRETLLHPVGGIPMKILEEHKPGIWEAFLKNPAEFRIENFYSGQKVDKYLNLLFSELAAAPAKRIFMTTHGMTLLLALMTILKIPYEKYSDFWPILGNSPHLGITILSYSPETQSWKLLVYGDDSYLPSEVRGKTTSRLAAALSLLYYYGMAVTRFIFAILGFERNDLSDYQPGFRAFFPFSKSIAIQALKAFEKEKSKRSEVRSDGNTITGLDLTALIRSKYGARHLLKGGPLNQPEWFVGFKADDAVWTELKGKGFYNSSYKGLPGDNADLRSFEEVAREIEAGKIKLPLIFKPNGSSDGRGIFILERNSEGRVVITVNRVTSLLGENLNPQSLFKYLDDNPFADQKEGKVREQVVSYIFKENAPLASMLTEIWKRMSVPSTKFYDAGMMEAFYSNIIKPDGAAFETRYAFEGAWGKDDIRFLPSNTDSYDGGTHTFSRHGASSYLANYGDRPGANMHIGRNLYLPLFSLFPELRNRREEFESYVQDLMRKEWSYLNQKLSALGIQADFEVNGYFDLAWLPPDESSQGFPVPALVEMHLAPENMEDIYREIPLARSEVRAASETKQEAIARLIREEKKRFEDEKIPQGPGVSNQRDRKALAGLLKLEAAAHGFGEDDGLVRMLSSMLDGKIRPLSHEELKARKLTPSILEGDGDRVWYADFDPSLGYGPDYAILSYSYADFDEWDSSGDAKNDGIDASDISNQDVVFYLVSSEKKKAFLIQALEKARRRRILTLKEKTLLQNKIYSLDKLRKKPAESFPWADEIIQRRLRQMTKEVYEGGGVTWKNFRYILLRAKNSYRRTSPIQKQTYALAKAAFNAYWDVYQNEDMDPGIRRYFTKLRPLLKEAGLLRSEVRSSLSDAEQFFKDYEGPIYYPASYTDWDSLRRLAKLFPKVTEFVYLSDAPMGATEFDDRLKEETDLDYQLEPVSNEEVLIHLAFKDGPEAEEWLRGRKFTVRYLIRDFQDFSEKFDVIFVQTPGIAGKLSRALQFWKTLSRQANRYLLVSRKETAAPVPGLADFIGEVHVEGESLLPLSVGIYKNNLNPRSEMREMTEIGFETAQVLRPDKSPKLSINEEALAEKVETAGRQIGTRGLAELIHASIREISSRPNDETEVLVVRERNTKTAEEALAQAPSAGTKGSPVAIAINQDGSVAGLPMFIPAETLRRALQKAAPFLKKVYYVTDYEVPESLRNIGVPTKRIFDGQTVPGEKSMTLIGKSRLTNPNLLEMNVSAEGEIDPQTAQLLLDVMLKVGALLSEQESRVKGDLIKKLLEIPSLRWILDPALAQFRVEGDRAILTFAASFLQKRLSDEKFAVSA